MAATMIRRPERASGIPEGLRQPKLLNGKPRIRDRGGGFQRVLTSVFRVMRGSDRGGLLSQEQKLGQLRLHFGHEIW